MAVKWTKTKYPGVRYYCHDTRMHGMQKDRYFTIRYRLPGKRFEEGLGWASEGMSASKASLVLSELKKAHVSGEGHFTLREKRESELEKKERKRLEKEKAKKDSVTFKEYFENVYFPMSKAGKKYDSYRKEQEHFKRWLLPVIGDVPMQTVSTFHCERIKKNLIDENKSPRTIQYVLATLRQVWNFARKTGFVKDDAPTKAVKIPSFDNKRLRFLSASEAETLLKELQNRDRTAYHLSLLSLHTGLRFSEMARLTWGNIDIERGHIQILDPKGKRNRVAFMTDQVMTMFKEMPTGDRDSLVFLDDKGRMLREPPRTFAEAVKDLKLNAGISDRREKLCFHSLRHSFASFHVAEGTDLYTLQKLMGHSVFQMVERYAHVAPNALQRATQNIEKAFNGKAESNIVEMNQNE